jgi:hypothetical protein
MPGDMTTELICKHNGCVVSQFAQANPDVELHGYRVCSTFPPAYVAMLIAVVKPTHRLYGSPAALAQQLASSLSQAPTGAPTRSRTRSTDYFDELPQRTFNRKEAWLCARFEVHPTGTSSQPADYAPYSLFLALNSCSLLDSEPVDWILVQDATETAYPLFDNVERALGCAQRLANLKLGNGMPAYEVIRPRDEGDCENQASKVAQTDFLRVIAHPLLSAVDARLGGLFQILAGMPRQRVFDILVDPQGLNPAVATAILSAVAPAASAQLNRFKQLIATFLFERASFMPRADLMP